MQGKGFNQWNKKIRGASQEIFHFFLIISSPNDPPLDASSDAYASF
ncbi:hypothetical protein BFJ70_g12030 [Fusarium oxysporum]|uniref:Uncharacterized protein n=2 Tax=Fusarium oxysporum TaxID=5507 RepID=A0A420SAB2_FUSOX|nr:hypothetical protein FOMA001_g8274 [Fusarium oxysporum f. sp. matthiolae]RKK20762.1 hypothetical protein BFJ65_g7457 [Fusarium oxysporum f. sp. cepae]RKK61576.1 hypothetical protein BFJ66_g1312 [Fusarium oxysporum f. sp. cepae]RKL12569.1 hypothetical protein BFJ68_g7660 [Fusarium oxysporum]RKL26169.1 hypothetical protein BFJ70_g12030 [Fusarium oxysporum]